MLFLGVLQSVWLAANVDKKLTKAQLLSTNLVTLVEAVHAAPAPLRVSLQLLSGIVRIYARKLRYLLDDVLEALLRLKTAFKAGSTVTLGANEGIASIARLTLPDRVSAPELLFQDPLQFPVHSAFDTSIEVGRADDEGEMPADVLADLTIDQLVELARNDDDDDALPDFSMADPMDFDLAATPPPEPAIVLPTPTRLVARGSDTPLRTTRKRLVVDDHTEITPGDAESRVSLSTPSRPAPAFVLTAGYTSGFRVLGKRQRTDAGAVDPVDAAPALPASLDLPDYSLPDFGDYRVEDDMAVLPVEIVSETDGAAAIREAAAGGATTFGAMVEGKSRAHTASAFFLLLAMATAGEAEVSQSEAFGSIRVNLA